MIMGVFLSIILVVCLGTAYATTQNAPPLLIEFPTTYYLKAGAYNEYSGTVPIPDVTAIDDKGHVRTVCYTPSDLPYRGAGNYAYKIGTHTIQCYITDGTHEVNFDYELVVTNNRQTGYVYPQQTNNNYETIPQWLNKYAEKYCNNQLSTKQVLVMYNYLDKNNVLDLDWNGLKAESVYGADLKKITCDWVDENITDSDYVTELRKLKNDVCERP